MEKESSFLILERLRMSLSLLNFRMLLQNTPKSPIVDFIGKELHHRIHEEQLTTFITKLCKECM